MTPGILQTFLVMDEDKGPRVIRFVILTKQQCFFLKETESLLLFFCLVCMLCWLSLSRSRLQTAETLKETARRTPHYSLCFIFLTLWGGGKEGTVLFQNQIQSPLLIVTHTDTKDTHLFSSVCPQFHSPFYAAFAREKHYN